MWTNLFSHIDIPAEQTNLLDGNAGDGSEEALLAGMRAVINEIARACVRARFINLLIKSCA